jgi:hypothetical protein
MARRPTTPKPPPHHPQPDKNAPVAAPGSVHTDAPLIPVPTPITTWVSPRTLSSRPDTHAPPNATASVPSMTGSGCLPTDTTCCTDSPALARHPQLLVRYLIHPLRQVVQRHVQRAGNVTGRPFVIAADVEDHAVLRVPVGKIGERGDGVTAPVGAIGRLADGRSGEAARQW